MRKLEKYKLINGGENTNRPLKLATLAPQTLCKRLMSKYVCVLSGQWGGGVINFPFT
jgi:hypothetical protein